jgi:hypothetical protein
MPTSELAVTADAGVKLTASTRAPPRLLPRMSRRTGLIEWFAHHEGGSTFVTCGDCAAAAAQRVTSSNETSGRRAATLLLCVCMWDFESLRRRTI